MKDGSFANSIRISHPNSRLEAKCERRFTTVVTPRELVRRSEAKRKQAPQSEAINKLTSFFMCLSSLHTEKNFESARGSQNCTVLSIICPFTGNSAFRLCVNDAVLGVPCRDPCRKEATEVFFCGVHTNKYIINTVLPSS